MPPAEPFVVMPNEERRIARGLRALLEGIAPGDPLPETVQLLMVLGSLEYYIPATLAELYPYWQYESLDGFFLAEAKKLDHDHGSCAECAF